MSARLFDCTGKVTLVTGGNGGIDCVFADSGRSAEQHALLDLPTAEWHDLLNLDLHGTFFTLREGARDGQARGGRRTGWQPINISGAGWTPKLRRVEGGAGRSHSRNGGRVWQIPHPRKHDCAGFHRHRDDGGGGPCH